jgi:ribosomal protein L7/L12
METIIIITVAVIILGVILKIFYYRSNTKSAFEVQEPEKPTTNVIYLFNHLTDEDCKGGKELQAELMSYIEKGDYVGAIKFHRYNSGDSYKEAKEYIDSLKHDMDSNHVNLK